MKTRQTTNRSIDSNCVLEFTRRPFGKLGRTTALLGAAVAGVLLAARPTEAGSIFVIAMENHNWTQPTNMTSPQQIFGNPAAPYINSLVTPGNPNAAQVSFATAYFNAGMNVHPSEPNYVWAEAGTDFGVHTDADPRVANGNTFYDQSLHLTALLDAAGVSWKNYQEDVDLSISPTNSASGTNGPINPYNGSTQFNYAVKHNPMAFFADTAAANVYPLTQLASDLNNNAVARYNWITPDQYNDAHSSLTGGFTYNGTHFTGDQSSIAVGDNFLSQIVPQIMASEAYKDNGTIIIWWDESEGGDGTSRTIPEIVISPLAKGNAYASTVAMNHSSDIKTWEELLRLPFINNAIPTNETDATGTGYNNVATVNDLSDLFVPGTIPAAPIFSVDGSRIVRDPLTHDYFQFVLITNNGDSPAPTPLWLALDGLSAGATLLNADGTTSVLAPLGSPYVRVRNGDGDRDWNDFLAPGASAFAILKFADPSSAPITYDSRVLDVVPAP